MRYLVTGSRDWGNWQACEAFVRALLPGDVVAHGGARGADGMVHDLLTNDRNRQRGTWRAKRVITHGGRSTGEIRRGRLNRKGDLEVHVYEAEWDRYRPSEPGRRNPAGIIRNERMLHDFSPDRCVYFNNDVAVTMADPSRDLRPEVHAPPHSGTGHMVKLCADAGVVVYDWETFVAIAEGER